jgi:hypothetical protein
VLLRGCIVSGVSQNRLQARRHRHDTLDLLGAQHRRQLLRLFEVPHLGRQSAATQRDAEQVSYPGHDAIAVADTLTAIDEVKFEAAHSSAVAVSGERLDRLAKKWRITVTVEFWWQKNPKA